MARTDNPDPVVVDMVMSGQRPDHRPNYATRVAAVRALAGDGYTDSQIGWLLRVTARAVVRVRGQHGIPGQRMGLNGYSRRHPTPNPVRRRSR